MKNSLPMQEMQEMRFDPWLGKIPWSRKWPPTPVPLPGNSHGQRSLAISSPWCHKELDMTEQLNNEVRECSKFILIHAAVQTCCTA